MSNSAVAGTQRHPQASRAARTVALLVIGVLFLLPMLWMLLASFDSRASFVLRWPDFTLANYRYALSSGRTTTPMWNSFLLAAGTTVLTTILGLGSAYALSRYHIRFRRTILLMVLFATGLPVELLMIPAYSLFVEAKLIDSIPATILFLSATALPFAIWVLKSFIDQIPPEVEEAAQIDGATTLERIRRHVLPLAAPGIAVAALFTFMNAWGQFIIPYVLIQSADKQPASVAIYEFLTANGQVLYGPLAAYALIFSVPVLVLYWLLSRYISGAFTFGGGVKG
ncbi:MAG: carbohydrate ABC transporter permease [Streptosporangiaceae bacterium]